MREFIDRKMSLYLRLFCNWLLTFFVGGATTMGGLCLLFLKTKERQEFALYTGLGFAGSVMIYVALVDLLDEAREAFGSDYVAARKKQAPSSQDHPTNGEKFWVELELAWFILVGCGTN